MTGLTFQDNGRLLEALAGALFRAELLMFGRTRVELHVADTASLNNVFYLIGIPFTRYFLTMLLTGAQHGAVDLTGAGSGYELDTAHGAYSVGGFFHGFRVPLCLAFS